MRYKIEISYDGYNYFGWQIQQNNLTIQEVIQNSLYKITKDKITIHGSGRTDRGVHAKCQVAHFDTSLFMSSPSSFKKALNATLPSDIRILNCKVVNQNFHARKNVISKEYRYFIWNSDLISPFTYKYKTQIISKLNVDLMNEAAKYLIGTHDFASFTTAEVQKKNDTIRTIYNLDVLKKGNDIVIKIIGNGFLYKMVRSISGLLIKIGQQSLPVNTVNDILNRKKRNNDVITAKPYGLFLWKVNY